MTIKHNTHKRASDIFADLIKSAKGDGDISVRELLGLLEEQSFCLAILVLALPNCLPLPTLPGFAALTGIPIILLAMQMIIGRDVPWLPDSIGNYSFSRTKFAAFLVKILPYIQKIERVFYPRMFFINIKIAERLAGIAFVLLGIILSLPIPFGNMVPGFAISFIAIGLMERDGVMICAGLILGSVFCVLIFTAIKAIIISIIDII